LDSTCCRRQPLKQ